MQLCPYANRLCNFNVNTVAAAVVFLGSVFFLVSLFILHFLSWMVRLVSKASLSAGQVRLSERKLLILNVKKATTTSYPRSTSARVMPSASIQQAFAFGHRAAN